MGFGTSQGLVGKSLQPEHSAAIRIRQQPLVKLILDDVRRSGDISTQHALNMSPRTLQIAQGKHSHADQSVANEPVARTGRLRRRRTKLPSNSQLPPAAERGDALP